MSIAGLDWQTVQFPLVGGLDTKTQGQALDPPGLSSCKNVEFDDVGGLRLRKPYASIGTDIYGGGTLSSVRKIVVVGDELLAFTATTLYSWSEALTAWVSRGEHLACASTETALFGNTSDQVFTDRAQLGNVVVYVWTEVASSSSTLCYLAARDATTGATLIAPTLFTGTASRPRVVAADSVIFVTWVLAGTGLVVGSVTPSAPVFANGLLGTINASELNYDVVRHPSADKIVAITRPVAATSYTVSVVTTAGVVTASTKARNSDGIVALACSPDVDRVQIVRTDGNNIMGDTLVLSTLADSVINTVVGDITATTVSQLTCAYREGVSYSGLYRCYVFWSTNESTTADTGSDGVQANYVTSTGVAAVQYALIYRNGLASRAFNYNGAVYVWTVFAKANAVANKSSTAPANEAIGYEVPVQNSYFLYRDDGDYFAKAAWQRAGGYGYYTGHLAGVALVSGTTGYAWCGAERNFTELGGYFNAAGYGARSPRDVVATFDSDDARRVVQLGRTAYMSGSIVLQYDGEGLAEVGFETFPWYIDVANSAAGLLDAGSFAYKNGYRWDNARGDTEWSTTAVGGLRTLPASRKTTWSPTRLRVTKKRSTRRAVSLTGWRTAVNPSNDSPYYLITSRDPSSTTPNNYVANDPTYTGTGLDQTDNLPDVAASAANTGLTTKEQHPENGAVLPRLAPPPASVILASDSRLFLAGIPGDPYAVVYSLLRNEGEIAGFNGALRFTIPATTGAITGLAFQGDTLVVFTASAIYIVGGAGYDNTGGGSNYGPPRLVSSDVGALSHDTIATTPSGLIFFSRKGWYRLSPGWDLEYIGAKVEDYNTDTWVAAQVVESQHQVRFLSSSRMLMFDYLVGEWSEWTQSGGRALARWRTYPMLLDTAVKKEQSTFAAADYTYEVVFGWLKPAQMQGMARVRRAMVLGEFKADHTQSISVGYDYLSTYTDGANHAFAGLTVGNPTQIKIGPSRQRCEAIRVKVSVTVSGTDCVVLTGLAFEVGLRRGLYARLPAAQKQ